MATRAIQIDFLLAGLLDPDDNLPLNGGSVEFYEVGTSTPKNVWTESSKTNAFTSITLDTTGRATIYGDGKYKIVIKDSTGAIEDTIPEATFTGAYFNVRTVSSPSVTVTPDDDLILCNSQSNDITLNLEDVDTFTRPVAIKKIHANNTVTVDPYSTQTVDGNSTVSMTINNHSLVLDPDSNASIWRKSNHLAESLLGLTATVAEINQVCDGYVRGGTSAGDIVTIDGTQTLTGKTLTSPKLNEDVAVTATATEINGALDGITAGFADLNKVPGIVSGSQPLGGLDVDGNGDISGTANIHDTLTLSKASGNGVACTANGEFGSLSIGAVDMPNLFSFKKATIDRANFTYNGGATAYTVKVGGAAYRVKDKLAYWNSELTTAAISGASADTWYYLYLDYSAITSKTAITANELIWSSTAPTYDHQYGGWFNGDDLCIFAVLTNGTPNNILEFFTSEDLTIFADGITSRTYATPGTTNWTDVTLDIPAFSTKGLVTFAIGYHGTSNGNSWWRTNGQSGATGHLLGYTSSTEQDPKYSQAIAVTDASQVIEVEEHAANSVRIGVTTDGWFFPEGM